MKKIISTIALLSCMSLSCTSIVAYDDYESSNSLGGYVRFSAGVAQKDFSFFSGMFSSKSDDKTDSKSDEKTKKEDGDTKKEQGLGFGGGGALGINLLSNYVSAEIEGKYYTKDSFLIQNKVSCFKDNNRDKNLGRDIELNNSVITAMVKGNVRFINFLMFSAHLTAGIGALYSNIDLAQPLAKSLSIDQDELKSKAGSSGKTIFERSFWQNIYPAYVLGGGISFGLSESIRIGLEYNYIGLLSGTGLFSNSTDISLSDHPSIDKISIENSMKAHTLSIGIQIGF